MSENSQTATVITVVIGGAFGLGAYLTYLNGKIETLQEKASKDVAVAQEKANEDVAVAQEKALKDVAVLQEKLNTLQEERCCCFCQRGFG